MDGWKTSFFLETPISRAMLISGRVYLPNISELTPLWGLFWTWATQHFGRRLQPFLLRRQYCEGSNNTRKMVVNCRENLFLVTCRWLWYALVVFFVDENAYGWLLPFLLHFLRLWKDEHISHSHLFPHLCIEMTLVLCLKSVCFIRPSSQVRFIKEVPVFAVTATFSVLAYLWLLIIVSWSACSRSCGVVWMTSFGFWNGSFSRIFES